MSNAPTHRIVVAETKGGPEVLRVAERPRPSPGAGEVLVRVEAAGVLLGDVFWQRGLIPGGPKPPFTPGYDLVGIVEAVGDGLDHALVGRRVASIVEFGGYAEFVAVAADRTAEVPPDVDSAVLSALTMPYLTAYQILVREAGVGVGGKVLIHGASGATGSAFLDLARSMGIEAWGTASAQKQGVVEAYGARAVDYQAEGAFERVRQDVPDGFALVVDPIGGRHLDRSWGLVGPGGALVATAAMSALQGGSALATVTGFAKLWLRDRLPNGRRATLFDIAAFNRSHPDAFGNDLAALVALYQSGQVDPLVGASFLLNDAADAQTELLRSRARGRVVLRPSP